MLKMDNPTAIEIPMAAKTDMVIYRLVEMTILSMDTIFASLGILSPVIIAIIWIMSFQCNLQIIVRQNNLNIGKADETVNHIRICLYIVYDIYCTYTIVYNINLKVLLKNLVISWGKRCGFGVSVSLLFMKPHVTSLKSIN